MILESVRAYYNGFYKNLVTHLPKIENGFAFPMDGIGLGVELNDTLLNSKDTFIKKTTIKDL
jgi:L-alanine-DL-glutamate epimerase-like enolase superfamily enzyme